MGPEGAKFLSQGLKGNSSLTTLSIGFSFFFVNLNVFVYFRGEIFENEGDNSIGAEGAKFISEALKSNKGLTEIRLGELFFLFAFRI